MNRILISIHGWSRVGGLTSEFLWAVKLEEREGTEGREKSMDIEDGTAERSGWWDQVISTLDGQRQRMA